MGLKVAVNHYYVFTCLSQVVDNMSVFTKQASVRFKHLHFSALVNAQTMICWLILIILPCTVQKIQLMINAFLSVL